MTRAFRVVQRNGLVYRRTWRGSVFTSFLQPTLFLLSMGVGVGRMVDAGPAQLPGDVGFLAFLAPGLLAGACMQTATFESTWPIHAKMTWQRNYEGMSATPLRPSDIILGELAWLALRLTAVASAFSLVMMAFGMLRSLHVIGAVASAVLTGLAFAAPIIAFAVTLKNGNPFNVLFRFIIAPLYLFSGVFFPISRLPGPLQAFAALTPLYHGVALTRGLTLGTLSSSEWPVHVAYLATLMVAGAAIAVWTFDRKIRV